MEKNENEENEGSYHAIGEHEAREGKCLGMRVNETLSQERSQQLFLSLSRIELVEADNRQN